MRFLKRIIQKLFKKEDDIMVAFIARMIEEATDKSLAKGIAKYNAYFVKTNSYAKFKADVDTILRIDGYEDVIAQ